MVFISVAQLYSALIVKAHSLHIWQVLLVGCTTALEKKVLQGLRKQLRCN
jgi:hypothetical protein